MKFCDLTDIPAARLHGFPGWEVLPRACAYMLFFSLLYFTLLCVVFQQKTRVFLYKTWVFLYKSLLIKSIKILSGFFDGKLRFFNKKPGFCKGKTFRIINIIARLSVCSKQLFHHPNFATINH